MKISELSSNAKAVYSQQQSKHHQQAFVAEVRVFIRNKGDVFLTTSISCNDINEAQELLALIYGKRNVLSVRASVASVNNVAVPVNPITATFRKAMTGSSAVH